MLKPMKPKQTMSKNAFLWILVGLLVLSGIVALIVSFRGNDSGEDEVNAVYTNAAATLAVQQLTLQASSPSSTPTTFAQTPTVTITTLASPTLFTQPQLPTNTSSAPSGAVGCNNSLFITDVTVPDNTVMAPGQTFTKTWKLQNTGSCAWTTAYKVSFVSGNAMGGSATPLTAAVQPGQSGDVSVAMTAPATAGEAVGYWILTNDSGQNFGTSFYVKIKVGSASTTGTATATATATTAAVTAPAAPGGLDITLSCTPGGNGGSQYEHAGTLVWTDASTNEDGFKVYVNGTLFATLPPGSASFTVPSGTFFDAGVKSTFMVEAYNSGGTAQATVEKACP